MVSIILSRCNSNIIASFNSDSLTSFILEGAVGDIELHHAISSDFSCRIRAVGEIEALLQGNCLRRTAIGLIADRRILGYCAIVYHDVISMIRVAVGRVSYFDTLIRRGDGCPAVLQLGYIDRIIIIATIGHIGNDLAIRIQAST